MSYARGLRTSIHHGADASAVMERSCPRGELAGGGYTRAGVSILRTGDKRTGPNKCKNGTRADKKKKGSRAVPAGRRSAIVLIKIRERTILYAI